MEINMRAFLVVSSAIVLGIGLTAAQGRGVVKTVTASPTAETGKFQFTVTGDNPCGAVFINLGDGSEGVTYAIQRLPYTVLREFERVGKHRVTARGMGNCDGEVTTEVTVNEVRPRPASPSPQPPSQPGRPAATDRPATPAGRAIRFAEMDANGDRVITRAEWRGSAASFVFHDWNRDNRLSDDEVRVGASQGQAQNQGQGQGRGQGQGQGQQGRARGRTPTTTVSDWSEAQFRSIDRNGDNRIARAEWPYDAEDFVRVDHDGNNQITLNEFLVGDVDDDRGDRFDDLDVNGDNRLERNEWHGSPAAFGWLDRNNDGIVTRAEAVGSAGNDNARGSAGNSNAGGGAAGTRGRQNGVAVPANRDWTDTGITLQAGDTLDITASGQIFYASDRTAVAQAAGAAGHRASAASPVPDAEIGALVGRIGNGPVFLIGSELSRYRPQTGGRLYLRVNDDYLNDNSGEFRAVISVTRR
jgi:hypothetical protein